MRKKTLGSLRELNFKYFQYLKEINEQRGFSNLIEGERQGSLVIIFIFIFFKLV